MYQFQQKQYQNGLPPCILKDLFLSREKGVKHPSKDSRIHEQDHLQNGGFHVTQVYCHQVFQVLRGHLKLQDQTLKL
jgi:hypothetical protein